MMLKLQNPWTMKWETPSAISCLMASGLSDERFGDVLEKYSEALEITGDRLASVYYTIRTIRDLMLAGF